MSEWWTYRPADFLMFAPATYWRLFELHNEAWWPAQPLLLLPAGVVLGGWVMRMGRCSALPLRAAAVALALAWAFVAVSFLLLRYAPINWAAPVLAAGFLVQAAGLAVLATRVDLQLTSDRQRGWFGALLLGWALLGQPLLAPAGGRPWVQAEVFGLAPDPTVIAMLAWLVVVEAQAQVTRWLLRWMWAGALAGCAISAATLWTMGSAQGWVMLVAASAASAATWAAAFAAIAGPVVRFARYGRRFPPG